MENKKESNFSPTVAAVIPTRNRRLKTERFLNFFTQQSYPNLNIIVVDANSTDGTRDMVLTKFSQVQLICVGDESYWTESTNAGVKAALAQGCDYILTINDDSYVNHSFVNDLLHLAIDNDLKILASRIDFFRTPGLIWALGAYSSWGSRDLFGLNYHAIWEDDLPSSIAQSPFFRIESAPGDGVLIHKSVFKDIGLYDEANTPHYHADSEFIMRAISTGIPAYVTPKIVVYNDCPLPGDVVSEPQRHFRNAFEKFTYVFFHKKSHLVLWPRIFVIRKYCPTKKKIKTYFNGVVLFAVEPVLRKIKVKSLSLLPAKVLPSKTGLKRITKKLINSFSVIFSQLNLQK